MPDFELDPFRTQLADAEWIAANAFSTAKSIADFCSETNYSTDAQDLVLRSLEHLPAFGPARVVINSLVRECGLFPYLDLESVPTQDLYAAAFHRFPKLGDSFLLHREQRNVLELLLEGKSVVLSAPTSFGKSALIDALITADKYNNVLIIVPTIALMDETRRRLTKRFSPE